MKKSLPTISLVIVDCKEYGNAIQSLKKSLFKIEPARTIFFTDIKAYNPSFPFEIIKIDTIKSTEEYSAFIVKKLAAHLTTDFVLVTQHDSWVLDETAWDDEYLEYDYIGASWPETDGRAVGNGGFSIRSRRLQQILADDDFIDVLHPEDMCICRLYRPYLEKKYGIRFAPIELADKFSFELKEPSQSTFGFHSVFHEPYKPTIVISRQGALGDCVALEPLLEYFHNKGNKVFVDMPIEIAMIYAKHFYNVGHISQLDSRIPTTVINLDGAYENNPKQPHLKSYFEAAGVTDYTLRNPKLLFHIGDHNRLFKKYIVIHNSDRDQPHRNVVGLEWDYVAQYFIAEGYDVIQVGLTDVAHIEGALYMNTAGVNMLMYLLAGASYFIGVDSGPASIAVALGVPSVIFTGSVNLEYIHYDMSNILWINNHSKETPICPLPMCWHESVTTVGQDCVVDVDIPPCSIFDTEEVIDKIEKFVNSRES